jgi:hypothetical protein
MGKFNKTVSINTKYKKMLQLQAIEEDVPFKEYLDSIIDDRAKALAVVSDITEKPLSQKKSKPKAVKKENVVDNPVEVIPDVVKQGIEAIDRLKPIGEDFDSPEVETDDSELDTSGSFTKKVAPGVYTNGKCFERRKFVTGVGIVKTHHATIEEAQKD